MPSMQRWPHANADHIHARVQSYSISRLSDLRGDWQGVLEAG